jgi:hypothetical protein
VTRNADEIDVWTVYVEVLPQSSTIETVSAWDIFQIW